MKIIVGCEFSQTITTAFRKLGHEAYSCDLLLTIGSHPEWHFKEDIFNVLKRESFDLGIFHPECTYLAVSGNRWMKNNLGREAKRRLAIDFFMNLTKTNIYRTCIENPITIMSTIYRKPDQYIQPYEYGHPETKKTSLWLKNLPKLEPTNIIEPEYIIGKDGNRYSRIHYFSKWSAKKYYGMDRNVVRSITYKGVAEGMAEQWGKLKTI